MFIVIYPVLFSLVTEAVLGVTLEQKDLSITKEEGKTVRISCEVTGLSSGDYVHWYQQKDGEALKRILYVEKGRSPVPDNTHKESGDFKVQPNTYDLKIDRLKKIHSGVYYCASWEWESGWVKVFGSGTRLYVTETPVKQPQVSAFTKFVPENDAKAVLLCQAKGMFPDLVRFTWQAENQNVQLGSDERLEQRDEDSEVSITSMLIIEKQKAENNKFTCTVQHDSSVKNKIISIPTVEDIRKLQKPDSSNDVCPTQIPKENKEEEEDEDISNLGLFPLSHSLYLFSVTYVVLLVKNVFYFCTVSVLLCMRNPASMEMIRGKGF